MSTTSVRNGDSSLPIDSYELYSSSSENNEDDDNDGLQVPYSNSVETLSDNDDHVVERINQSVQHDEQQRKQMENLPSHIIERLNKLTQNDIHSVSNINTERGGTSRSNLYFAAGEFDADISDNDHVGCDDDGDYSEETSETGSNSSYGGGSTPSAVDITSFTNTEPIVPYTIMDECIAEQQQKSHSDSNDDTITDDYVQHPSGYSKFTSVNGDNDDDTSGKNKKTTASSSSAMISSLKKRWKGMKKAGARGTTSAGRYLGAVRESETFEERHSRIGDEWINCIIPVWKKKRKTSRVRALVFRGIPANVRGRVWQCAIGNALNISEELFDVLKDRAKKGRALFERARLDGGATIDIGDAGEDFGDKGVTMEENERSAHKAISLDLPRTFPELSFFHAEGSHYEHALRDVLEAFLYLKPDVGYSQGMSFVAAVLLLYMDPYEAFSCFSNMVLYKSFFLNFFRIKMPEVKCYLLVHEKFLEEEMPALFHHFKKYGIDSDLYMINWVMSLYCRALRLDLVTRIWDLYVLDGDVAVFRSALGILRLFMNQLLAMKFEDMAYFLSHIPSDEIDADEMLQSIRSIRVVSRRKFIDLFQQFRSQH